jgi:hypothetical protein
MVGFKTLTTTISLITVLSLSVGLTARAHANNNNGDNVFVTFEHSAATTAGWVHYSPPPPGDPDDWSIKLQLPKTDVPYPFANAILHNVAGPPPATAPSFDFLSNIAGPSGGSPRLVMCFSGAPSCYNKMELRPLAWVANLWTTVDGNGPNWDNRGAGCPTYGLTYTEALACHAGQTVLDVHISTDSSWLATVPPTGYIHYIDNIHYGSAFIPAQERAAKNPTVMATSKANKVVTSDSTMMDAWMEIRTRYHLPTVAMDATSSPLKSLHQHSTQPPTL